ncbi:hypothetical protein F7734_46080 [Scytonema sp. UIC 10036]|uniref:hypothetical protein n=1 Tax=Scytonema sp. UIC 10036 TaxID=2304196 RepID=UPI0012DA69B1|nr:hypothetical protein [Scytonema sp. UIC 10036]MUG99272.1 hypothetical protein [Scytonema sp. UIC 10036]
METNTSFSDRKHQQESFHSLENLQEANRAELENIVQLLAKVTSFSPQEVKPHLDAMLERLVKSKQKEAKERPFYETATPQEWVNALREWSESHDRNIPLLSDYAVSREGIYEDERF